MKQDTKKKEIIKLIASSSQAFTKESIANLVKTTPDYVYDVALEAGLHRRLKGSGNLGPTGKIQYPNLPTDEERLQERVDLSIDTVLSKMEEAHANFIALDNKANRRKLHLYADEATRLVKQYKSFIDEDTQTDLLEYADECVYLAVTPAEEE